MFACTVLSAPPAASKCDHFLLLYLEDKYKLKEQINKMTS